jgi:oligopeptide/dipeptide ABC transporter ATP-binding protein
MSDVLLAARDLVKTFPVAGPLGARRRLRAVDGVSFALRRGETLGVVGESGCGKSTLGRLLLRLIEPDSGALDLDGQDLLALAPRALRGMRRHMQMVFQDPVGSLNPRMTVEQNLVDTLRFHGRAGERARIGEALREIGLGASYRPRYPHELSGGQAQRVAIARALILNPELIVLDEPVSALDVSIRAQILKLLIELRTRHNIAYVFISHDIGVVRRMSDRIAVLYLGRLAEIGDAAAMGADPLHPYSRALLAAELVADPRRNRVSSLKVIEGDLPSPIDPPSGCRFHTRCPAAMERCRREAPPLFAVAATRSVACFLYESAPSQAPKLREEVVGK